MSQLKYRTSTSFTARPTSPRPTSNTSSYRAFDPVASDTSDSRGSISDLSPITPSLGLPLDADILLLKHHLLHSPAFSVARRSPSPSLLSPQLSPYLESSWIEPISKGPLHPGLADFNTEAVGQVEFKFHSVHSPGADTLRPPPSPVVDEPPASDRSCVNLRPLFLAARASAGIQQGSRPTSAPRKPSRPDRSLRQLQLMPTRNPSQLSQSLEDLSVGGGLRDMLHMRSSRLTGDTGGIPYKSARPSAGEQRSSRQVARPFTAPHSPGRDDAPTSTGKRFPVRYPASKPQSSMPPPERAAAVNGGGSSKLPPGSSPLAARLLDGSVSRADSESWRIPHDTDGDFIRKTYAHFARAGVPDDGFADGKEYTREKAAVPAWEEAPATPSTVAQSRSRPMTGVSSISCSAFDGGERSGAASLVGAEDARPIGVPGLSHAAAGSQLRSESRLPFLGAPLHSTRSSGTASPGGTSLRSNGRQPQQQERSGTPLGSRNASPLPGMAPSPAALSAQSTTSETGRFTSEEWQQQREAEEKKRAELMSKVDRYGFFLEGESLPSHNRTILLPKSVFAAPLPRRGQKKDRPKPTDPVPVDLSADASATNGAPALRKQEEAKRAQQTRSAADQHHRNREKDRIAKWQGMLEVTDRDEGHNAIEHDFVRGVDKRLRRRVYKGIPDILRGAAWWALILRHAGSVEGRASGAKSKSGARDQRRLEATGMRRDHAKRFSSLLPVSSPHDVQIDLDVPRTIGGHVQFHTRYGQGQRSLFHVLHSISLLCPDCGYCQGMGPIAATLLCYFSADQAYAAMVMLHHSYSLHGTFSPGFPGLVGNFYVQNQLVKTYMPEIAAKLDEQMVVTSAFATKWYITLFSNTIPFETQLRIWDAWLLEGQDVITLVAVAIIWSHRAKILSPQADFETILGALSGYFVPEDDDALLGWIDAAMQRKDVRETMDTSRREWQKLDESGESSAQFL